MSIKETPIRGSASPVSDPTSDPSIEISRLQDYIKTLKEAVAFERACFEQAERERVSLVKQQEAMSDLACVLRQDFAHTEGRAKAEATRARALEKELNEARQELENLNRALKDRDHRLNSSVQHLSHEKERAERLDGEKRRLKGELERAASSIADLTKRLEDKTKAEIAATTHATEASVEIDRWRERVTELEAFTKTLERDVERLKRDLHAAEQLGNETEEERQRLVAELAQRPPVKELYQKLKNGLSGLDSLLSAVEELQKLVGTEAPPTPSSIPDAVDVRAEERERVRKAIAELEKQRAPLQQQNDEFESLQEELQGTIKQLKIDFGATSTRALQNQIRQAEGKYERIRRVREPIQDHLVEIERRMSELQHRLDIYADLERSIEELLQPMPYFIPPSIEEESNHPLLPSDPPPMSPDPKRRARASRASDTSAETSGETHSSAPPQVSSSPMLQIDESDVALHEAAERYNVTPLAILVVSLYQAVERGSLLTPTPSELLLAAKYAGIWTAPTIPTEEALTNGTGLLRNTPLNKYISFTRAQNREFYVFRPGARTSWRSPVSREHAVALNAVLRNQRLSRN